MLTMEQAREMRQGATLTGDRNQCCECGELFNSNRAFDRHRTGTYGVRQGPDARRCLSHSEMRLLGMTKNSAGFWIASQMADDVREWLVAANTVSLEGACEQPPVQC
ncbi:hypothetical protein [Caballeronia sp. ATUFL_F1_KS39]|uniref:hypothetical protein n=1 Tax=Caballeronia sp. ATUFL_F1_KS39 TaxID=2921766 RepID=UPI0020285B8E|nr:hypothetical protein [Caballeronia sp. ATUFL_F1_KS39]